jgi:RNA polymerase subunit RPABC4/transcription elongation factor Spt4
MDIEFDARCYNQPKEKVMTVDPRTLSNLITVLAAWGAAFLVALWVSLIIWTYRDIRTRTRDQLIRILSVIIVALLFLPGILIYIIMRPSQTIEEEYQQTLEEEALLQSIEDIPVCPGCGRKTQEAWMVCPTCHTRLKKTCHNCRKLMELSWNLCPYCGTPAPGKRRENMTMGDITSPPPVDEEAPPVHAFLDQDLIEPDAFEDDEIEDRLKNTGAP